DLDRGVQRQAPAPTRVGQLVAQSFGEEVADDRAYRTGSFEKVGLGGARALGVSAQRFLVQLALAREGVVQAAAPHTGAAAQVVGGRCRVAAVPEDVHRRLDGRLGIETAWAWHGSDRSSYGLRCPKLRPVVIVSESRAAVSTHRPADDDRLHISRRRDRAASAT